VVKHRRIIWGKIMAKRMIPSQLEKAQDLARNFAPRKSTPVVTAKTFPPSSKKFTPPKSGSTGSGFFVSKLGHVITNAHVVRNCGSITVGDNAKKIVRRHINWNNHRPDLKEDLAPLVKDIKRRICGIASAGSQLCPA